MSDGGFISLHRKMLEWEWFDCPKHLKLFIVLLLKANWKDTKWRGHVIKRGQLLTGIDQLSHWTKLSKKSIRTALVHLESTGELARQTTNRFSIITLCNYEKYQDPENEGQARRQATGHTKGKQRAASNKENKENKLIRRSSTTCVAPSRVKELYNTACKGTLSEIKTLSDKRIRHIKAISKYIKAENEWSEYFTNILASQFLTGDNDRGWRADFDWIVNQNNYLKVVEGKYENRSREKEYDF